MTIDNSFEKRVRKVVRTHDRMRINGVVRHIGRDGLIRTRPRITPPMISLMGVAKFAALMVVFKAVLYAQMGVASYTEQLEELRAGSMIERVGAIVMHDDPITSTLGALVRPIFAKSAGR